MEVQNIPKCLQIRPNWVRISTKQFAELIRDEARHGKAFAGLLERYFGKK